MAGTAEPATTARVRLRRDGCAPRRATADARHHAARRDTHTPLLHRDAAVLVYPGGDEDVFRSWRERNHIHLAGRTGFIRLALRTGVPIVPIVSVGGHETVLCSTTPAGWRISSAWTGGSG